VDSVEATEVDSAMAEVEATEVDSAMAEVDSAMVTAVDLAAATA
jgi:hypothetical protein